MSSTIINVLLTSFDGLDLPPTLAIPVLSSMTVSTLKSNIISRFPQINSRLILTTTSNKELHNSSNPISSLLANSASDLLPLRLSAPLCGGKGGFGSQLRAAGGRMSSKRKKHRGDDNGSSRNLDGRRLRTVTEAKALAEYLAVKPEMDKREKEARKKRWEQVVEMAEKKETELRSGSKGRVDGQWAEEKDEAGERTREAVLAAMRSGNYTDNTLAGLSAENNKAMSRVMHRMGSKYNEGVEIEAGKSISTARIPPTMSKSDPIARIYLGFDEDDDFMSEEEDGGNSSTFGKDEVAEERLQQIKAS